MIEQRTGGPNGGKSEGGSGGRQPQRFAQNDPSDASRARAQCDTDADFIGPAGDGVRYHAVDADRGKHQGERTKDSAQRGQQALLREGASDLLQFGMDVGYRQVGIDRAHGLTELPDDLSFPVRDSY